MINDLLLSSHQTICELRSERNQREARVLELEKELSDYECKWKESEVEMTRNRQNLSEVKQKCASLTDEVGIKKNYKKPGDGACRQAGTAPPPTNKNRNKKPFLKTLYQCPTSFNRS